MSNSSEQQTIRVESIFLNDSKPQKWNYDWEWKPSVSISYVVIDDATGAPSTGELKGRVNGDDKLWIFQAMGGKRAKGRFFLCMIESGSKDGKPWYSPLPVAEVFPDGTMRKISAPKDGTVSTPAAGTQPPPGSKLPPKPTPPVASAPAKNPEVKSDPNYAAKANAFFKELDLRETNAWWIFKRQCDLDGANATNSLEFATRFALLECGHAAKDGQSVDDWRMGILASLGVWQAEMARILADHKHALLRARLAHLIGMTTTSADIALVMKRAWEDLPNSHYEALRAVAEARAAKIKAGEAVVSTTLQPEAAGAWFEREQQIQAQGGDNGEEIPW